MILDRVRALVFDVFGTVVDWRSGVVREAAPFLARHGAANADPAAFANAWRNRRWATEYTSNAKVITIKKPWSRDGFLTKSDDTKNMGSLRKRKPRSMV